MVSRLVRYQLKAWVYLVLNNQFRCVDINISFNWRYKGESDVLVHDNGGSLRSHDGLLTPLRAS